ncbi:alpha/beta fold hydrolase [SAR92 clade bacterium H455]|uniref:Alpha/beta fold hydrolase n=1 Tax=SAR92 clade bacterium H455 TaxID=2974818 RepID=A0ABY5TR18_9GAMM|nr:alpha/beta fold hydrolase [SAR92 clade bacterium H455]
MKLNYSLQSGDDHLDGQNSSPAVILIHGMFGSLSNLGVLARSLVADYQVISVDLRNHGDSPHELAMDLPLMAADIVELMDDLGLARATLIGHSLGGKVAMQVALNNPDRVSELVVIDIAPVTYGARQDAALDALNLLAEHTIESRRDADALISEHIAETSVRAFLLKNLSRNPEGDFRLKLNLASINQNYSSTLVLAPTGQHYEGPTLFLKGEHSAYIQEKHRSVIEQLFPHSQLEVVADTAHWLHAEKPETVNALIRAFIETKTLTKS